MITISEHLIVTKELNEVVCRYAQKVLLKDFLLQFTFSKSRNGKIKITTNIINSLLEELSANQGDIYGEEVLDIIDFIENYTSKLDQNDKTALYFLVLNENYENYFDDFLDNLNDELDKDSLYKTFGRLLARKIYNPEFSGLDNDLKEFLQDKITSYADDVDLNSINKYTIEHILETIESHCNDIGTFVIRWFL